MTKTAKTALSAGLLLLVVAVALVSAAPAYARSCAQKVIDDWWDDNVVQGVYPLSCYRQALKSLPDDLDGYSSAREDIERALAKAIQDQVDGGPDATTTSAASPPPSSGDDEPTDPAAPPPDEPTTTGVEGAETSFGADENPDEAAPGSGSDSSGSAPPPDGGGDSGGPANEALDDLRPDSPDGLPLPILIVSGLAILLLAAGSAGVVSRRLQARKAGAERPPRRPGL